MGTGNKQLFFMPNFCAHYRTRIFCKFTPFFEALADFSWPRIYFWLNDILPISNPVVGTEDLFLLFTSRSVRTAFAQTLVKKSLHISSIRIHCCTVYITTSERKKNSAISWAKIRKNVCTLSRVTKMFYLSVMQSQSAIHGESFERFFVGPSENAVKFVDHLNHADNTGMEQALH